MKCIIVLCFAAVFLTSCKTRSGVSAEMLQVDLNRTVAVDVSGINAETVRLDSLAGSLDQVVIKDSFALVKASGTLLGIDLRTGRIISQYSRKGRAPGEYLTLWSVGIDGDNVYIYDINSKKVMYFDYSGQLLKQVHLAQPLSGKPFQDYIRSNSGFIIGKRVFGVGEIPELALYDSTFCHVSDISDFNLRSGAHLGYPFCLNHKGEIYYVRSLLNDVYLVDGHSARKVYSVDFGRNNIPALDNFKDEMEIINFANRNPDRYATFISNIYDSEDYFCFMFFAKGKKMYAVYEKAAAGVHTFEVNAGSSVIAQIVTSENKAYIFWESESGDIYVTVLPIEHLLKMNNDG